MLTVLTFYPRGIRFMNMPRDTWTYMPSHGRDFVGTMYVAR